MRLLLIPLLFIVLSGIAFLVVGDRIEVPGSFAEAIAWLRSFDRWAWAAGMGVIIADFILPMPSTPAFVGLGSSTALSSAVSLAGAPRQSQAFLASV